ncbi:MAG: hypothetical protein KF764_26460 [Labilithrix sp.]|nr:hypothetical protein [Labilithrix sp.]
MIRRKLVSTIVALATFAVVWLVVSPASATTSALGADPLRAADLMSFVGSAESPKPAPVGREASFAGMDAAPKPVRAMAPVCDPRGAIGFAPPPQIQDLELSLDIPADCFEVNPLETKNYVPGHHLRIDLSSSQEPVAPTQAVLPPVELSERLPVRACVETRPSPGVRASLDRPPRV